MLKITNEQKKLLVKHLPDVEKCIITGDIGTVLDRLDDKITENCDRFLIHTEIFSKLNASLYIQ